tara:strand:- start:10436 stop:11152 length:717 start_codon:yes stop_codon:yes gene_type:complete
MPTVTATIVAGTIVTSYMANKAGNKMTSAANAQAAEQLKFQKEQQVKLDKQKEIYKQFQFENPYKGINNYYEGMENTMEDLTVNTQQAEFQMEQGAQQRANIMQSLRGAAGGSGVAGLAQSLANQGVLQAAQVSAQIGQQERQNQMASAQTSMQLQMAERQGMSAADMAQRGGDAMVQQAEMSRQSTLLGMEYGGLAGANAGVQSAYANQMNAQSAASQMQVSAMNNAMNMYTMYKMS